ncbi:hypothetical protein AAFF_G00110350 [Aldrovandia affinis]|uniref:Uncharacterized protein n=1 Tax=Aldrovandia affinis TaxID=143900 RepID=A0AAD7WAP8_9TELE|nr:hypothetical protein AAFF_G00110350 [Aldrovandia affinis]
MAPGQPASIYGVPKKVAVQQLCSSGLSNSDRHYQAVSSLSQPLNLSQIQPSVTSQSKDRTGSSSSRQQRTHTSAASSNIPYRLQEASFFGTAPNLYTHPTPQAVDSMHGSVPSSSSHHTGSRAPYSSLGLLHSDSSLHMAGPDRARYQHHFPAQPYTRSNVTHGCYQFSPRKLNQHPYL